MERGKGVNYIQNSTNACAFKCPKSSRIVWMLNILELGFLAKNDTLEASR